jgi:hypothetical protein
MLGIVLTGLVAGLASALLYATVIAGSPIAIVLFYAAPLPLMIAGLGWNHRAAAIGGLVASAFMATAMSPVSAIVFIVSVAVPAWVLSYLALLGRREGDQVVEWLPTGQLVMAAAMLSGAMGILGVIAIGPSLEEFWSVIRSGVELMLKAQLGIPESQPLVMPDVADPDAFIATFATLVPPIVILFYCLTLLFNLWLAARVAQKSGRLMRPWSDFSTLDLPRWAVPAFVASAIAAIAPGHLGLFAEMFAAALLLAFILLGLAVLHDITRGLSARALILGGVYFAAFAMGWPLFVAAGVGLAERFLRLRDRFAARRSLPPTNNPD